MPEPISEQIAAKVKTRLELITTGNGYSLTASDVARPTRLGGFKPDDFLVLVNQGDIERNDELSHPGNPPATAWDMPFEIQAFLRTSEKSTVPVGTWKNRFWADIVKALNDDTAWYTWDGLAINSVIGTIEEITNTETGDSGVMVPLTVTFRTDETDPYTLRG